MKMNLISQNVILMSLWLFALAKGSNFVQADSNHSRSINQIVHLLPSSPTTPSKSAWLRSKKKSKDISNRIQPFEKFPASNLDKSACLTIRVLCICICICNTSLFVKFDVKQSQTNRETVTLSNCLAITDIDPEDDNYNRHVGFGFFHCCQP